MAAPLGKRILGVAAVVVGLLAVLAAVAVLWDAAHVAISDAEAATYHFGSEAMVGHGGWAYRSRGSYIASSLVGGTSLLLAGAFAARAGSRGRNLQAVSAAFVALAIVFGTWLYGRSLN